MPSGPVSLKKSLIRFWQIINLIFPDLYMKKIFFTILVVTISKLTYSQVEIIAHRGASFLAPENTVASSKLAWKMGADAVEVDIYLSKDNKIMCIHDSNTKRTSGQDFKISDTDSEILRKLDVGTFKGEAYKGEKIPFLNEIIEEVPIGKELVIEIKCGSEVLQVLKREVKKYEKNRKFVFIAFDFQTIADTKKVFPDNPCYWLCSNPELLKRNLNMVAGAGLDGISLSYGIINEQISEDTRRLKLGLFAWTVDDPEEAKRLISLGVMGITTNRPGWLNERIF